MTRALHRAGAPALIVLTLGLLAVVNVAHPAAAPITPAVESGASCNIDAIRGGVDWVGAIDGGCALSGIGAVFFKANPVGLAFCAGWAVGRWLDGYIYE